MNAQNDPSKHHYIPAFYLRGWEAGTDSKLIEFSKPHRSVCAVKPVRAVSTGFKERLYSMDDYPPELSQAVETKWFKPVDDDASNVLEKLRAGVSIPTSDSESRSAWARFIMSLLVRCPEDILDLRVLWRERVFGTSGVNSQEEYNRVRPSDYPENFADYLRSLPLAIKEFHQFQSLISMIDSEKVGTRLINLVWEVVETSTVVPSFLTSDRPVIRNRGAALHFALPISPRQLFIAAPSDVMTRILRMREIDLVKDSNRLVVEGAQRFVYGVDDAQKRFVFNRISNNRQPRVMEEMLESFEVALEDL